MALEIKELLQSSLDSYFTSLSYVGYSKEDDIEKLLVLSFIEELCANEVFKGFITEEDYNALEKALYCLLGSSCHIPYPSGNHGNSIYPILGSFKLKLTEQDSLRKSDYDTFRYSS